MNKKRLLLVDDEEKMLKSLNRLLSKQEWNLITAQSGKEALELINNNKIDAVISDHKMPGMTGLELMRQIKEENPDIIRIILTGLHDEEVMLNAINLAEVHRFFLKSKNGEELVRAVKDSLEDMDNALKDKKSIQYELSKSNLETVMALAEAIELKDPYTKGHCSRVRDYSLHIARRIHLSRELIFHLIYASLLHDCGKIGISEKVLLSKRPLNEQERKIIEKHSILGYEITSKIDHLKTASLFIRQHHERWDGTGYPDGLSGEDIHICSQIIGIADTFDAMTTDRPYRKALEIEDAKKILLDCKGKQFDPHLVDVFISHLEERESEDMISVSKEDLKSHPPNILIVDDEWRVIKSISRSLFDGNYHLLTAESGKEGLELIRKSGADLIISDHLMPEMTGVEFLKKAKKLSPDSLRIMLTGYADINVAVKAINEAGIYKLLLKPCSDHELKSTIRSALEWRKMFLEIHAFYEGEYYGN